MSTKDPTPRRSYTPRRLAATLDCGCTVHYPRGVPANRGERVTCAHHNRPATITATRTAT